MYGPHAFKNFYKKATFYWWIKNFLKLISNNKFFIESLAFSKYDTSIKNHQWFWMEIKWSKKTNVLLFSYIQKSNFMSGHWHVKSCLCRKQFRSLYEYAAQCYLKHQKEEFYKKFYWVLALQNEILKQDPIVQEVLSKEYQLNNSYQGKYCNLKNIYGPWYLENMDEQKHLVVFNLFDENDNYERFTYPL